MSVGKSKAERFEVLEHVFLAIQHSEHQTEDGFRHDLGTLVKAIVTNETMVCTCRQRLFGDLRKSPAWPLVRPFLIYGDAGCCGPKCGHDKSQHSGPNGECSGKTYNWSQPPHVQTCSCKGPFVPKDFK